jgi:putative transposase
VEGPKSHTAALKRLRRANKALARKRRFSANWRKQKSRLARLHARIANVRRDATHKLTTRLAKTFKTISIEDLNVSAAPLWMAVSSNSGASAKQEEKTVILETA